MRADGTTQDWIEYAERDYETAKLLMGADKALLEIVAFHCQQAVEKYLKAVLVASNEKVPYVHDLAFLNRKAQEYLPELKSMEDECERLTPYGTLSRYPQHILEITEDMLPLLLKWTEGIRKLVRDFLIHDPTPPRSEA